MGGAMDLVTGAKKVIVAMEHVDKRGNPKILKECNLPLTAKGKVSLIITDLCVLEVTPAGLVLKELSDGVTVQQVIDATEAELIIPDELK
jgi:3-oxoacid CoA-transferase B subunit